MKRPAAAVLGCVATILLLTVVGIASIPSVPTGTWQPMGSMVSARSGATAVLLQDHSVLIAGGDGGSGAMNSAEVFNPDGTFAAVSAMGTPRAKHVAVALADGRVLVAGGESAGGGATNSAEIYDPSLNTWTAVAGGMVEARSGATAASLKDGRVLVAGGQNGTAASATVEIFDPGTGQFSFAGAMSTPRMALASANLADGRVLMSGGSNGSVPVASSDIFDPTTNTISAGPAMTSPRQGHSATALLDGRVLVAGGKNGSADLASAEILDAATGGFAVVAASLAAPRRDHAAILLPNNNAVLFVGGTSAGIELSATETFTPWTGTFLATGATSVARQQSAVRALTHDGLLLMAGGTSAGAPVGSAELYGFATVKTDAADYAPGSVVTIAGTGWQPGETVTLTLVESPLVDTHPLMTAVADGQGNITNSQFTPDEHDLDIRFYLTAVGSQSGYQAQNTFTDAKPNTVTVGAQTPTPIAPGSSATYTITVNFNGNGSSCTAPLSVSSALPAGASPSFSPSSVTSTGGNVNSTLTITTTNVTPPGSTTFTVLAANGGGTCQAGTASNTGTLNVQEPTTTTLNSGTNPTVFGQSTLLTATVARTVGLTTPNAGTVTFNDGATTLGTGTLNASGVATLAVSSLTVASHNLTASYGGTASFGASSSGTVTQVVSQAAATAAVSSGTNPSAVGQSVTFTATVAAVAPGAGVATGTVTFKDGATTLGTGSLSGSGVATLATSALALGLHSITAVYNGDVNFTGSTSSTLTQTVTQATTTTAVASSVNPSVFGQSVTFAATVTASAGGTPTGTVTFKDGATTLGTGAVSSGQATFSTSALSVTTHSITAVYGGDSNFTGSASSALSQVVNQASSATALTASPNPSVFGQTVNFTVTVAAVGPGAGTPTGTVQVKMGSIVLSSGTLSAGQATIAVSSGLTVGANGGIKAFYSGDLNFAGSQTQNALVQAVNQASTTTNVTASPSPSNYGQSATFTTTVAVVAPGAGTPTGAVNFYDGGTCTMPGTSLGSGTLSGTAPFQASVTTAALDAAHSPHAVLGCYAGDANFLGSNGGFSQTVNKASVTATIVASDKTYDGTNTATITSCTINGKIGTDDVGCTTSGATFAAANASASAQTVTAPVTLAGLAAGNYVLSATTATTTATINKKSVTPSITAEDKDYDGTNAAAIHCTVAGVLAADAASVTCSGAGTFADANAGPSKTVTSNNLTLGGSASGNYTLSTATATTTATIRKVDPTISVSGYNATYNAAAHTATGTATGVGGVDLSASLNLTGTTHTDAGDYLADAWTFTGSQNYNDKSGTVHDHIDKANSTITVTPYGVTYDGDPHTATGTAKGIGGVDLSGNLNLTGTTHTAAGHYTDTWTFTGAANYNDATSTVNDAIAKADPVVTATAGTATYDGTPHGGSASAVGVKGEALTPVNVAYQDSLGALLTTAPVNAGNYSVAARYAGDTNYNAKQSAAVALIISKADAHIALTPYNATYNGDPHTASGTATGVETPTPADLSALLHLGGTTHTGAGDYPTDTWTFDGNENYNATSGTAHDAIAKADPIVTATGGAFTYDGTPHGGSATAVGVKGEALTPVNVAYMAGGMVLLTSAPVNAGTYSVAARYAGDVNYNQKQSAAAALTISKADAHISVASYGVTYDGNPHTATGSATGVEMPTPADLTGLLHLGGTTHTTAGDYLTDSWTFDGNENYNATSGTVHDHIDKADPIVTATGGTFTYDGNPHGGTGTALGVQGESLTPVNVAYKDSLGALLTTAPVNAGNYSVAARYAGDTNYNQKQSTAAPLVISKADAHITVTGYNVTYDTNAHTATGTATGVESPTPADLNSLLHLSGTTHTDAGDFTDTWTFDGNENYNATSGTVHDHMDKANATVTVTGYSLTYNALAHTATGTATGVGGVDLSASLNLTSTSHTDAGDYPTDPWSFSGGLNYKDQSGTVHNHIEKAEAIVNVTGYSVTYTGAPHAAAGTATGVGGADLSSGFNFTGTSHTDAGDYPADPWSFAGGVNYKDQSGSVHDHIDQAAVTAKAGSGTAIYDGAAKTPSACAVTGAYTGDLTCTNSPASVGPNAGTTSTAAVVNGTGLTNFQITYQGGSFAIAKAASTTTVTFEVGPYVYRATAFTAMATATGAGGLNVSVTPVTYSGDCLSVTVANGCTGNATYTGDDNHYGSSGSQGITITPATPTITVTGGNFVYDGNPHSATGGAKGIGGATVPGTFGFVYTPGGNAVPTIPGVYSVLGTFTSGSANYSSGGTGTVAINIGYGLCSYGQGGVILPPINSDGSSVYQRKGGSTIPVKFKVCAANGSSISNPAAVFGANSGGSITLLSTVRGTVTVVNEDTVADIPDVAFRWDGQQWIFNMATTNLTSGSTYMFRINLANGSIQFMVGVK